jgi:DNA-binding CsgD family transcriptional regulator
MYRYSRTEFDRTLEFVRGLYEPRSAEGLREHLLSALRALVPVGFAASGSYHAGPGVRGQTRTDPPGFISPEADTLIALHGPSSRVFTHFIHTQVKQFTRWSDLQPVSEFVRTALYNEVYRLHRVRDCCTLFLYDRPDRAEFIAVGLHKQVSEAHRDMLVSISPHVHQAVRLAHTTSALLEMAATKSDPNHPERGLIAIDVNGRITMETGAATRALAKFFPKRTTRGLPEQLAHWMSWSDRTIRRASDVPDVRHPFVTKRDGDLLTVHLFSRPEQNFLMFEQHRWAIDPAALSSLLLTRRESEVLAYVAVGKTNREIGIILGISSRTVSKHVEHILEHLGVETRTAAAASALTAANF